MHILIERWKTLSGGGVRGRSPCALCGQGPESAVSIHHPSPSVAIFPSIPREMLNSRRYSEVHYRRALVSARGGAPSPPPPLACPDQLTRPD